jgi:hypothetical protein
MKAWIALCTHYSFLFQLEEVCKMSRDFARDTACKRKTPKSAILDTQPT